MSYLTQVLYLEEINECRDFITKATYSKNEQDGEDNNSPETRYLKAAIKLLK